MQRFNSQIHASDALLAGRIVPGERFMIAGKRHRVVGENWLTADDCGESHPVERLSCRLYHGHDGDHWTYDAPVDGHSYTWSPITADGIAVPISPSALYDAPCIDLFAHTDQHVDTIDLPQWPTLGEIDAALADLGLQRTSDLAVGSDSIAYADIRPL